MSASGTLTFRALGYKPEGLLTTFRVKCGDFMSADIQRAYCDITPKSFSAATYTAD